jgi:tol-pal system protein YbgF
MFMLKLAPRFAVLCLLTGLSLVPLSAVRVHAQDSGDSVNQRLDRLEHDLNELQRQVYRSSLSGNGSSSDNGDTDDSSGNAAPQTGNQALSVQLRMDQLDSQIRDMTGQIEEVQYGISQLKTRLDKMQSDDELRFQALEHPGSAPGGAPPAPGGDASAQGQPPADNGDGSGAGAPAPLGGGFNPNPTGLLTPPGSAPVGGGASADAGQPVPVAPNQGPSADDQTAAVPPPAPAGPVALPSGSPGQQYGYAFDLLRKGRYADAQQAFSQFLKKHPKDTLAGNAQYWLGETYFAQNQYQQAAAIFAQGYTRYPQSPKASDNLLKLGISLGITGHKREACLAFAKLDSEYPKVLPAVKDREAQEKRKFSCS